MTGTILLHYITGKNPVTQIMTNHDLYVSHSRRYIFLLKAYK